jgi:hypothetical protein
MVTLFKLIVLHSLLQISLPKEFRKDASRASLIQKTALMMDKDVPELPSSSSERDIV